jgi:hypothetical protein
MRKDKQKDKKDTVTRDKERKEKEQAKTPVS